MTKVKICGITNLEDALVSAKFGADALGFNFYQKSPRFVTPENARSIGEKLPPGILKVGVFVNENQENIVKTAEIAKLDAIQLHGEESPDFARELKTKTELEIIKAFRAAPDFAPESVLQYETDAVLLDAYNAKEHGGTGETFDWEIAEKVREIFPKMYLAGGLSPDNVAKALFQVKPFAVDACSCLESEKGKKDRVRVINFLGNVNYINQKIYLNDDDLIDTLRGFRASPRLNFIGKSITALSVFLFGYLTALSKTPQEFEEIDDFLKKFEEFEGIKRGNFINGIYHSYAAHFLAKSGGDEKRAFDVFFARLEEFILESGIFRKGVEEAK